MSGPDIKQTPVILDFDGAVLPLSDTELRIPLAKRQEAIRFGCSLADYARLQKHLAEHLAEHLQKLPPEQYCPVFTGSGDYHHLTLLLLQNLAKALELTPNSLDIIVADNHPDNMRYLFGLHCGSWVYHASGLSCVRHIHVIGISSEDIGIKHAWENYLGPFWRKKLTYWSVKSNANWLGLIGRSIYAKNFASADALLEAFLPVLRETACQGIKLYLSIDKDVLTKELIQTNWDQGSFELRHLEAVITACSGQLLGADITGDISRYDFSGGFKRFLTRLEGQVELEPEKMPLWQSAQQKLNRQLFAALSAVWSV
jgi:hypothetical protein